MIFTRRTLIEVLVPLKPLFSKLMEESLARSVSPRVLICQCLLRRKATVPNVCLMFSLGCHFSSWTNQAQGGALRLGDIRSGGVEGSAKLIPGGSNLLAGSVKDAAWPFFSLFGVTIQCVVMPCPTGHPASMF